MCLAIVNSAANPQIPNTVRQVACHPVNNLRGKRSAIPPYKMHVGKSYPKQSTCKVMCR